MKKELKVVPITNGSVIDHITAGQALNVLRILGITTKTDAVLSVVINVPSKVMGRKDIVKVEELELKPDEVDKIALIAPNATINIIRDSEVIAKHRVYLPGSIEGIIRCANPNCISNAKREPVISKFVTVSEDPPRFRCFYCERIIEEVSGYI
ncbi:aspartate carbamoyltransferase regulatory subunit [Candidatus Methanophagaceae archaeon]|jgi:aspartate carbamoyltransferase regulatory subunit|nr:aspartate carbamoyltransferase regulatory subunit [Methanophagales archaeon]